MEEEASSTDRSSGKAVAVEATRLRRLSSLVDLLRAEGVEVEGLRRLLREAEVRLRSGPERAASLLLAQAQTRLERAVVDRVSELVDKVREHLRDLPPLDPRGAQVRRALDRSREAQGRGDLAGRLRYARLALDLLAEDGAPP